MAVAMDMLENVNEGKEASPVVKRIKERFNLCFHYLKDESSVQDYFLKRLPNHINSTLQREQWETLERLFSLF